MRWAALFDDLEAQSAALDYAERAAEVEERARGELATLTLADRARASLGAPVRLRVVGAGWVTGRLERVGPDWWLLDDGGGREIVLAGAALCGVAGLGRYATPTRSAVAVRIGLRQVLRGIARDRSAVRVVRIDASVVDGTLDRVAADFVEVAVHPAGEARRPTAVREVELVPLTAIALVRRSV